jgi:NDP-sugar pyrophosphorylase family protein
MTRAPVAAPVTATVTTSEEKTLSKTQKGMEFLRNASGKVFVKDLCEAMGLEYPKYSPRQYFSNQIRLGEVVCDGKWYVIGTPERTTPLKQKAEVARKPLEKGKEEAAAQTPVLPTPTVTPALNQARHLMCLASYKQA